MEQEDASSDSYSDSGTSASEAGEEPIYITEIQEERLQIAEPTLNLGFDFQTLRCLKWLLVNQKDVELEVSIHASPIKPLINLPALADAAAARGGQQR